MIYVKIGGATNPSELLEAFKTLQPMIDGPYLKVIKIENFIGTPRKCVLFSFIYMDAIIG